MHIIIIIIYGRRNSYKRTFSCSFVNPYKFDMHAMRLVGLFNLLPVEKSPSGNACTIIVKGIPAGTAFAVRR